VLFGEAGKIFATKNETGFYKEDGELREFQGRKCENRTDKFYRGERPGFLLRAPRTPCPAPRGVGVCVNIDNFK